MVSSINTTQTYFAPVYVKGRWETNIPICLLGKCSKKKKNTVSSILAALNSENYILLCTNKVNQRNARLPTTSSSRRQLA